MSKQDMMTPRESTLELIETMCMAEFCGATGSKATWRVCGLRAALFQRMLITTAGACSLAVPYVIGTGGGGQLPTLMRCIVSTNSRWNPLV